MVRWFETLVCKSAETDGYHPWSIVLLGSRLKLKFQPRLTKGHSPVVKGSSSVPSCANASTREHHGVCNITSCSFPFSHSSCPGWLWRWIRCCSDL